MQASLPLDPVLFEACLKPHRSLGRRGLLILLSVAGGVSLFAGLRFAYLGAWPVLVVFLLDLGLLWGAFKLNNWAARRFEAVELREGELLIRQVDPRGRERAIRFQPYWVRLDKPDPEQVDSQLVLRSHGRAVAVGSFLPHAERLAFADALGDALRRIRSGLALN
ncbi:DUF2244 domain-containing protein [Desertibaculum subflavum]|uniref:DUF2244 domain-containing protein n=1 Tax=Desertibaculum subflavum TaxID=2268458 RepID=UPI0013C40070